MSLAEFAIAASEVKVNRSKSLSTSNGDCIEIKNLVHQITNERRRESSSMTIPNLVSSPHCHSNDEVSSLVKGECDDNGNFLDPRQTLDRCFKLMQHVQESSAPARRTISTTRMTKRDDKHQSHRQFPSKRQRPWTAPNSHTDICARPSTSTSCSLVCPLGMDDVQIFCVDPDMMSIISNFEEVTKDDDDDDDSCANSKELHEASSAYNHMNLSSKLAKKLNIDSMITKFHERKSSMVGINSVRSTKTATTLRSTSRKREEKNAERCRLHQKQHRMQNFLQNMEENKIHSFQLRDERILNAKQRRLDLRNYQLNKLEENLRRKEQQRLDHLSLKKKQDRQQLIITTMILVSTSYRWLSTTPKIIEDFRYSKLLNDAARKIQLLWKREMFSRKAMEAKTIQQRLKSLIWRIQLWHQCARRRLNAQIIRQLFREFASNPLPYLIFEFRRKVITAQKMMRSFLECKRARIYALELCWARMEKDVVVEISNYKHRRRKNALNEITQKKILLKSENHMPDEKHGFANVVDEAMYRSKVIKEKAPTDPHLCRLLCRFHLEDSRRVHMNETGQREVKYRPSIHLDHALILLSGKDLEVHDFSIARQWSLFSLFLKQKASFRNVLKDAYRNEATCRKGVEIRLEKEKNMEVANHFATNTSISKTVVDQDVLLDEFNVEEKTMTELRVIFQLIDLDCNDKLSSEEISKLFLVLGYDNEHEYTSVDSLTNDIHGGDLDYKTFISTLNMCSKKDTKYSKHAILEAFRYFSKDNQGRIHGEELLNILQSYSGKWDKECAYKMMKNAGLSTTKYIDYRELVTNLFAVWNCNGVTEVLRI